MPWNLSGGAWSSDGNVWYNSFSPPQRSLFRYDFLGKTRETVFVPKAGMEISPDTVTLSPDGKMLAFIIHDLLDAQECTGACPVLGFLPGKCMIWLPEVIPEMRYRMKSDKEPIYAASSPPIFSYLCSGSTVHDYIDPGGHRRFVTGQI